jgi:hypothetical protein
VSSGAIDFTILINGKEVSTSNFQSFVVERDINQPDMCAVVLANQGSFYTAQHKVTDPIEIQISGKPIYKGEVVGVEPQFKGGGKTTVLFRGMNKLHKLIRKRQSVTYTDKTEKQILQQVLGSSGLSIEWQHEKLTASRTSTCTSTTRATWSSCARARAASARTSGVSTRRST